MERQQQRSNRDRKPAAPRREVGNSDRYDRNGREQENQDRQRDVSNLTGLNKSRLNDLYERSSI